MSFPQTYSEICSSSGGGTDFLIREPFTQLPVSLRDFSSFESSNVTLKLPHTKLSVFNIYRPPPSANRRVPFSKFLDEFSSFFSLVATTPHEFIITDDFNIHLDNPTSWRSWLAVWCSSNALVLINAVALHRARLVLRWVTAFGQVNCLIT